MDTKFTLPFFADMLWVSCIFISAIVVFHLLFVWVFKLNKIAWKYTDYIWLGVGAIGLIGTSAGVRDVVVVNQMHQIQRGMTFDLKLLKSAIEYGKGPAICRYFAPRAEIEKIQKEADATCAWFKAVAPLLPQTPEAVKQPIAMDKLPAMPPIPIYDNFSKLAFKEFSKSVLEINQQVAQIDDLRTLVKPGASDDPLKVFGPVIMLIALALRITKVTGEIKKETS